MVLTRFYIGLKRHRNTNIQKHTHTSLSFSLSLRHTQNLIQRFFIRAQALNKKRDWIKRIENLHQGSSPLIILIILPKTYMSSYKLTIRLTSSYEITIRLAISYNLTIRLISSQKLAIRHTKFIQVKHWIKIYVLA